MNDTSQAEPPGPEPTGAAPTDDADGSASGDSSADGFQSKNMRTITAVHRSNDDRIVAGVCAGIARHLNIDPIIVRIGVAALTFIGLAGLILYLAAWFLLPADDEPRSVAAEWFNLDRNEEQFRAVGLFVAAVVAVIAIVGDGGWSNWWIGWWILPAAFFFWLLVVRPRHRREEELATTDPQPWEASVAGPKTAKDHVDAYTAEKVAEALDRKRARLQRRRESRALRRLTFSLIAIAVAVTLIADRQFGLDNSSYLAAALTAVAVGCLIGAWWGDTAGLGLLGIPLVIALAVTSAVPNGRVGEQVRDPHTLAGLQSTYRHGVGRFELNLSKFDQPSQLVGKTVAIESGIGQTVVYVPDDLPVRLDAHLRAGEITYFGHQQHGQRNELSYLDGSGRPFLLVINQRFGEVQVIRR